MPEVVVAKIEGLETLMAELRALPPKIQTTVLRGAMGTAGKLIRNRARDLAPYYSGQVGRNHPPPGTLKAAIYSARLPEFCSSTLETWQVGVRSGKAARHSGSKTSRFGPTMGTNLDAYYAYFVEFGHWTRTPKGPGTRAARRAAARASGAAKWVAPQPFMRRAYAETSGEALRAAQDYIDRNLRALSTASSMLKAAA